VPQPKRRRKAADPEPGPGFSYQLRRDKLRQARRREGRYLLRSNMPEREPAQLWEFYLQLTQVEEAFKHLKSDLSLRPFHHKKLGSSRKGCVFGSGAGRSRLASSTSAPPARARF